jgi:hypothetical protein
LNLENEDIKILMTKNTQLKTTEGNTNYEGIISVPMSTVISSVDDKNVLSAFKV